MSEETMQLSRELKKAHEAAGVLAEDARVRAAARKQMRLIPKRDTRDLTGKVFGDPITNDPRRPWLNEAKREYMGRKA